MAENRILGDFIHNLRINGGLSLRNAASNIGISAMYLSEMESGKKVPSGAILRKISDYYGADFSELLELSISSKEVEESSNIAVARIVSGLTEEKARKVLAYIQKIEKE